MKTDLFQSSPQPQIQSGKIMRPISGFSKLTKNQKIDFLVDLFLDKSDETKDLIKSFWHDDKKTQKLFDEFSENTLTNFYFPYGIVPNMLINQKMYCVPMVIEESSVVAASAKAAKFWMGRGGFKTRILGTEKIGQVHLIWEGEPKVLFDFFEKIKPELLNRLEPIVSNMKKRGGGLSDIKLVDRTSDEPNYYQVWCTFETCDAMGANFINSVLEAIGQEFKGLVQLQKEWPTASQNLQVVMAILSNYTPECLVESYVECPLEDLHDPSHGMEVEEFVEKFTRSVRISKIDVNRATTHNKGIFNGIDAVILATGNDFRAIEACGHTYACRDGKYRGLTDVEVKDGKFRFSLKIPMALGTVGGLTSLHPLAKVSLDILDRPSAPQLMQIVASIGLAQNFAALRSLVTSGIQKGHMKMHLMNILNHLEVGDHERALAKEHFKKETISFNAVREFIQGLRQIH